MILVTGGTGFIGSHLLDRLSESGQPVRALVRRKTALPPGVEPVLGDLATGEGLAQAVRGASTIVHIAGVTKALNADGYYTGNVRATEQLARAAAEQGSQAAERGSKFVHVSSLAVCGPNPAGEAVAEDIEPHPITDYGKSKLEAERVLRAVLPQAVIVRPPVVYGPRDTGVFTLLKSISRGVALEIGGGARWFSLIYVQDLIDGILAASRNPAALGRTYFLSHADPLNWSDLRNTAARLMQRNPRVLRLPVTAAYGVGYLADLWSAITRTPGTLSRDKIAEAACPRWVCDCRRAAEELHFRAATPLEAGLRTTLAWYKEAGWLHY